MSNQQLVIFDKFHYLIIHVTVRNCICFLCHAHKTKEYATVTCFDIKSVDVYAHI